MLYRKVKKYYVTKKETSSRQVTTSKYHSRKDDHGKDRTSRSMNRNHHSPSISTRINHASSDPGSNPSVSLVRSKRRMPEADILQGELGKIKPPTFNGEHVSP
jgi:type VI protein secretion system component VasA